ncbi:MAG TPA: hypothetical protein VFO47_02980, partial [Actinomycetes bacterium]|nr:hypothetical protein [Actinomycetes bacterium]
MRDQVWDRPRVRGRDHREGLRHLRLLPGKVRDAAAQAIKGPIAAASSTGRADDSNDVRQRT